MYSASKAAVNAFTESMAVELAPLGIRVPLVLPGRSPETRFAENARREGLDHEAYAPMVQQVLAGMRDPSQPVTHAADVAEAVWCAATDPDTPVRLPSGEDALALARGG